MISTSQSFRFFRNGIIIFYLLLFSGCSNTQSDLAKEKENTYKSLEQVLEIRKLQLNDYLNNIEQHANKIKTDSLMLSFFLTKKEYYEIAKDTVLPDYYVNAISVLKSKIEQYYLLNYLIFNDILFINNSGDIFYTIRKEKDYHNNIFSDALKDCAFSRRLRGNSDVSYVDFNFYDVTKKNSAFYIEPVIKKGITQGWFVLEFSIKTINDLFQFSTELGKTGEILLVNQDNYLLSNSRFDVHNTVLVQKLPKDNIEAKFNIKKGRKEVVDYRNKKVMSAFEVVKFYNTEWLITSKIDLSEVLTNYYVKNQDLLFNTLLPELEVKNTVVKKTEVKNDFINVEMDEFKLSDNGKNLFTQGVSTCTAVIISYPGYFSYLGHISPYDVLYNEGRTDILGKMLERIDYYKVTEVEKQNLVFYIISPQSRSLKNCIAKIVDAGYFLSQIKIALNADADYANVIHNYQKNETTVQWIDSNHIPTFQNLQQINSVERTLFPL